MLSRLCCVGVVICLQPGLGFADTSLLATGAINSGYSDNILGVPETDNPDAPAVRPGGYVSLNPGLNAAYTRRNSVHNLDYVFGARVFFDDESGANVYTNALTYAALITLSPLSNVAFRAAVNAGRVSAIDQVGVGAVQPGEVLPDGDVEFVSYNATASYRRILSQIWSGETSLSTFRFVPDDPSDRGASNLTHRTRLEHSTRRHQVGGQTTMSFSKQDGDQVQRSLIAGVNGFWTWDISDRISSNVTAGISVVGEYPDFSRGITVPGAGTLLTYRHDLGQARVGWSRGAAASLFDGLSTITNQYFLAAAIPLPTKRPISTTTSLVYASGDVIDLEIGDTASSTERYSASVGVAMELTRALSLSFGAESTKQTTSDPRESFSAIVQRTVFMVTIGGRFPTESAGEVPTQSTDRVDGTNSELQAPVPEEAP